MGSCRGDTVTCTPASKTFEALWSKAWDTLSPATASLEVTQRAACLVPGWVLFSCSLFPCCPSPFPCLAALGVSPWIPKGSGLEPITQPGDGQAMKPLDGSSPGLLLELGGTPPAPPSPPHAPDPNGRGIAASSGPWRCCPSPPSLSSGHCSHLPPFHSDAAAPALN